MASETKTPPDNLQEVNLDDEDSDSSSGSEGEVEAWNDEEAVIAPAPSPIPLSTPPKWPASTSNNNNNNKHAARPLQVSPNAPATVVKDIPPSSPSPTTSSSTASSSSFSNSNLSATNRSPNISNPKQPPPPAVAKGKTPPREGTPRKRQPRQEEEDVSSRAAVALAAVAAAATANNTSPSAAAQAARAVAQTFVRGANRANNNNANNHNAQANNNPLHHHHYNHGSSSSNSNSNNNNQNANILMQGAPSNKPRPIVPVKLELVKEQLLGICGEHEEDTEEGEEAQQQQTRYPFVERLAHGENDAFLQCMLMLAYYRATDDFPTGAQLRPTVAIIDDDGNVEKGALGNSIDDPDVVIAEEAANALLTLWRTIEGSHKSMIAMLPKVSHHHPPHQHNKPRSSLEDKVLEVPSSTNDNDTSSNTGSEDDPSLKDESSLLEASGVASFEAPDSISAVTSGEEEVFDEPERPVVVPDLLPPCTSARGDVTIEFFRACQGRIEYREGDHSDSQSSSDATTGKGSPKRPVSASTKTPPSPQKIGNSASSVFSSMLSPLRRNSNGSTGTSFMGSIGSAGSIMNVKMPSASGFNVFRKSGKSAKEGASDTGNRTGSANPNQSPGEYTVQIEREMLGLTVENVLERTVVRTVLAGGPAKKAGAKIGSLIVKVGSVETKNLTHFETIDELRQSQRPLQLVLRLISDDALRSAREEMGRLIRGSGFGIISNGCAESAASAQQEQNRGKDPRNAANRNRQYREDAQGRPLIASDLRIDAYSNMIRERFLAVAQTKNKNEETVDRAAEKLVWILHLFVIGLEHESARLFALAGTTQENPQDDGSSVDMSASPRRVNSSNASLYHHTAKDYAGAARSVSKILLDFVKKNLDPSVYAKTETPDYGLGLAGARGRKKGPPSPDLGRRQQPLIPGMQSPQSDSTIMHDKPLLQIGDVLSRTRTFLVDPTSPPAALIRGELIAFLCDVLDIDKEMELSEEEAVSQTAGEEAGPITDLGSAGSMLKLIVMNCSIMRSPECESVSYPDNKVDPELTKELRRRFGGRAKLNGADVHRLHAGNRFLSVVHRLAASRSTSARITACSLGPVLWGHLDFPHQLQLRGVITRALHDAEVIVRKSTATVLHEIAELVFDQRAVPWLILMCERAMTDPEPQLRSAAMTLTWHLAEHLPNAFLGDASQGSRFLRRLPNRSDPVFADVYLLQCKLLPVATRLAEDRAPSVRLAVAAQCDRLCGALGDHWSSVIIDVLLALLTDTDERVRCEAVMCVPRLSEVVLTSTTRGTGPVTDFSVLESLLPAALMLQKDKDSSVRVALATAAGELLTLLVGLQNLEEMPPPGSESSLDASPGSGKLKKHVDDVLIPLVQNLLHDKDPEVTSSALRAVTNASRGAVRERRSRQMSVASGDDVSVSSHDVSLSSRDINEPVFLPVLSEAQVLRLLPTLAELGNSKQWRVRQSAVEIVPALLGCTRNLETRKEISQLCVRLMEDPVDAVRKTAAECLCLGGSTLGSHGESVGAEWITSIVVPHVRKCAVHSNSKQRLLSLKMIEAILVNDACPAKWVGTVGADDRVADSPMREFAVIALSLANDKVPNVRLNVGRVLESTIHMFEDEALSFIKEVLLQQLVSERERPGGGDRDVLFFASRCIRKAGVILEEVSFPQSVTSSTRS